MYLAKSVIVDVVLNSTVAGLGSVAYKRSERQEGSGDTRGNQLSIFEM